MAGFGLVNLNLDGKQWGPVVLLAGAAVAGYFLFSHLKGQQAQTSATNSFNAAEAPNNAAYSQLLQLGALENLLNGTTTPTTAPVTSSGTAPNPGQAFYSSPTASGANATASTTSVGGSNPGSI